MLTTPDALGLSEAQMQDILARTDTYTHVQAVLAAEGFTPLPKPDYACPGYLDPNILDAHDSRTLSMEYAKYKAWRDFTANRLMYTKQILLQVRNQKERMEAICKGELIKKGHKKLTKEVIVGLARMNPTYATLEVQEQDQQMMEITYETKLSEFGSSMQVISRAITLRGQDIQEGTRANNIGAGTPSPRTF